MPWGLEQSCFPVAKQTKPRGLLLQLWHAAVSTFAIHTTSSLRQHVEAAGRPGNSFPKWPSRWWCQHWWRWTESVSVQPFRSGTEGCLFKNKWFFCYVLLCNGRSKNKKWGKKRKAQGFLLTASVSHQRGNDTAVPPCEAVGHCMQSGTRETIKTSADIKNTWSWSNVSTLKWDVWRFFSENHCFSFKCK